MGKDVIRIGGGGAGWGDGGLAVPQLVNGGDIDYLVMDFLSEFFLPVLGRDRRADPSGGYAKDFAGRLVRPSLRDIAARRVKVITNAGGCNPQACVAAFKAKLAEDGLSLKVAWVGGDDLFDRREAFRATHTKEMFTGSDWPQRPLTAINAYLGAGAIAKALAAGADIVVTGRVVDSALVLGPLVHEFGWAMTDYDRLAGGSTIGHLLECGAQATGGLFTDWEQVEDYANIGYPIAECRADGSAVITKVDGTGGLVSVGTLAEQLLYEIGDSERYILPDVVVDFSHVRFTQVGPNRVRVEGARGRAPTPYCKASASYDDGWRASLAMPVRGPRAKDKAVHMAEALQTRALRLLRAHNLPPFSRTLIESFGDESSYGAQSRDFPSREAVCRLTVEHESKAGIDMMLNEVSTLAVSMVPGNMAASLGRTVAEVGRVFNFLVPKSDVEACYQIDDGPIERAPFDLANTQADEGRGGETGDGPPEAHGSVETPLSLLAWVRNGDKGNASNVGVIARRPEYLPFIAGALTAAAVRNWYKHWLSDGADSLVERFYLPGCHALNFLLHDALDGGCTSNMRLDALGKSMAQEILDFPILIPPEMARELPATV